MHSDAPVGDLLSQTSSVLFHLCVQIQTKLMVNHAADVKLDVFEHNVVQAGSTMDIA